MKLYGKRNWFLKNISRPVLLNPSLSLEFRIRNWFTFTLVVFYVPRFVRCTNFDYIAIKAFELDMKCFIFIEIPILSCPLRIISE